MVVFHLLTYTSKEPYSFLRKTKSIKMNIRSPVCLLVVCSNNQAKLYFRHRALKFASPEHNEIGSSSELILFYPPLCARHNSQQVHVMLLIFAHSIIYSYLGTILSSLGSTYVQGPTMGTMGGMWEYTLKMLAHNRATCTYIYTLLRECRANPCIYVENVPITFIHFIVFYILLSDLLYETI